MSSISLVEIAYNAIRNDIITAEYMPGTLLSENELSIKLNMSRTPIRGAISRLESEGLVNTLNKRGLLVREITLKELLDCIEISSFLQIFSVDSVIEKKGSFNLVELKSHLEKQFAAEKSDDYYTYLDQSLLFYRSMVCSTKNNIMIKMLDSIRDKTFQAAIVNWKKTPLEKHYSANRNNEKIFKAIEKNEYEDAKLIINENYRTNLKWTINNGSL